MGLFPAFASYVMVFLQDRLIESRAGFFELQDVDVCS